LQMKNKVMQQTPFDYGRKKRETTSYKPFVAGPNPDLNDYIQKNQVPYDPDNDPYDVPAFDHDLIVDKATPPKAIYDMHTYWSKKHWAAIREYIRHYLPKEYYPDGTGLILDCFSGSGMTGVAAIMENRPCIIIDASATAAFISYSYTHPVTPGELQDVYEKLMTSEYPEDLKKKLKRITDEDIVNLKEELEWLYATKCDRCGGDAITEYVVYSERYQCQKCGEIVALFDCPEMKVPYSGGNKAKPKVEFKTRRVCPHCLKQNNDPHRDFVISTRSMRFGSTPVMVSYKCLGRCKPKRDHRRHNEQVATRKARFFAEEDQGKIDTIERAKIPYLTPQKRFTKGYLYYRDGLHLRNIEHVTDLYTTRNVWALSAIKNAIKIFDLKSLMIVVSATALGVSCLVRNRSAGGGFTSGSYSIPAMNKEIEVFSAFNTKIKTYIEACRGFASCSNEALDVIVSTDTCQKLDLPQDSVDFVFTDPPYSAVGGQYAELNEVWGAWLDLSEENFDEEIVVNPKRNLDLNSWLKRMRESFLKVYYALKPGRWAAICYHDISDATWKLFQDAILDVGFKIESVTVLDPLQKSLNQTNSEKVVKSDLVLNCRKPRSSDQQTSDGEVGQVSRRVRDILIETLSGTGGQFRDKLWDIVLKRLLSRGQMAEHRFEDILNEVAVRSESGRWFLKEEFENLSENDLINEEGAGGALIRFARLRCMGVPVTLAALLALEKTVTDDMDESAIEIFIQKGSFAGIDTREFRLGGRLKGSEFYDCLFFYLTRYLKGRPAGKTPRRNLAEFLEEYLVRFHDGDKWLYRPPTDAEADSLRKSRQTGLGRRIRQFTAYLNGEGDYAKERIPDAKTLLSWLKHCANFGLAEAGIILYEKGGLMGQLTRLTEDERYDAEDYYAQCRRSARKSKSESAMTEADTEEDKEVEEV
jgi:hypothetical protein